MRTINHQLFPALQANIERLDFSELNAQRKHHLTPLAAYIQSKVNEGMPVLLNFVCTHNSRRSHLSQIWAQALSAHYQIPQVYCYSGGSEATALFPLITQTLETQGFQVAQISDGTIPIYSIKYAENAHPVIGFSKVYDDAFNPKSGFAAILTCSQADADCPHIAGAEMRFPIPYQDPKEFDRSPLQREKYLECSVQIATELSFVFSQLKRP